MAHWDDRTEPAWRRFQFKQPYAKGLARLKAEVLADADFDPATLWQWGTMQAMALIGVLRAIEVAFGAAGQRVASAAIAEVGRDVGRQILEGTDLPPELTEAEFVSFYATVINRIAFASLESPKIETAEKVSFDIRWCPHQDHYGAFDCRVQRYFVTGMMDAAQETMRAQGWQVRFDTTIPAGAPTCHFTVWRTEEPAAAEWLRYSKQLEERALAPGER